MQVEQTQHIEVLLLMFSNDTLAQLKQLKQQLKAQKDLFQGKVKDSPLKTAAILLDDGRQALLPAEESQKVFPHDQIKVTLTKEKGNQLIAEVEELVSSELKEFTGKIVVKGKAVFVVTMTGKTGSNIPVGPEPASALIRRSTTLLTCRARYSDIQNTTFSIF